MQNELKTRIMRRVYAIWFLRRVARLAGKMAGLIVLAIWGLKYVSPTSILTNAFAAADGTYAFLVFFIRAFENLSPASQFAFAASLALAAIIGRDLWLQGGRLFSFREKLTVASQGLKG